MPNRNWWLVIGAAIAAPAALALAGSNPAAALAFWAITAALTFALLARPERAERPLRSFVDDYLKAHRAESTGARAELDQLRGLLGDATSRLAASFETIHALSCRQEEIARESRACVRADPRAVAQAAANDGPAPDAEATVINVAAPLPQAGEHPGAREEDELGAVTRDLERSVSEAVTALQFQDIATQLVSHTAARLDVLDSMAGQLERLPHASADELGEALAAARAARRANPITQMRLTQGATELF